MKLSLLLMEQILSLFLVMAVGYLLVKIRFLAAEDSRVISQIVVYVCTPCVIIDAFQIPFRAEKVEGLLMAGAAAVVVHVVMMGVARLLRKALHLNGIEEASIVYSNAGNLVIPLVAAVLGKEWVFYTSGYITVQTFLIWTHGITIISGENRIKLKNVLYNSNILAIAGGLLLFFARIQLPRMAASAVSGLGDMIGPASMLVIGMLIGGSDLLQAFRKMKVYLVCVVRLLVIPAAAALSLAFFSRMGLHKDAEYIFLVVLLATSSPVAVMVTQLSQLCDKDAEYAGMINVVSVVFCILTMPLMVALYEWIA